jgi:hypothetical protein
MSDPGFSAVSTAGGRRLTLAVELPTSAQMQIHSLQQTLHGQRVSLGEAVAGELRLLAIAGFTALRRRGLEVGGLLLGRASEDELLVEGFLEVPCEHRYGPSYALSETDREKLTELLAQVQGGESRVIGAFRSFTGRDPAVEAADHALVLEHFPQGDFLLLFLQPLSAENCVTSFHLFRGGRLLQAEERTPDVLDPQRMPEADEAESAPTKLVVAEEQEVEPVPAHVPKHQYELVRPPRFEVEPEAADRRPPMFKAALICMAIVLGGSFVYELGRAHSPLPRATAEWTELNLDARPGGGKVEITWDAKAARSVRATRGALTISDGDAPREIELAAAQVGAGRYTYAAERPDIAIKLTLSAGDRTVASESARLTTPLPITPSPASAVVSADLGPVVAPTAVHEVHPTIPEGIRSRLTEQVLIGVEVQVSDLGRVTRAKSKEPGEDGLHRYLASLAEKTAHEWRFTPARNRDGHAISAVKTIQFVFTR